MNKSSTEYLTTDYEVKFANLISDVIVSKFTELQALVIQDMITKWLVDNLILEVFIGDINSEEMLGTICQFKLFKNKYLSIRKATYPDFLDSL